MNSGDVTFCIYVNSMIGVTMTWDDENRLTDYDCGYKTCGQTLFCKWYNSHPIGATHQEISNAVFRNNRKVAHTEKVDGKLSKAEFEEIETLVHRATTALNKKSAENFITRLEFMQRTSHLEPYASGIFGELVSSVKAASGQVKEKEHWLNAVNQSLYKLEAYVSE